VSKKTLRESNVIPLYQERMIEQYERKLEEFESLVSEDLLEKIRAFYVLVQIPTKVFEQEKFGILTHHFVPEAQHPYDAVAEVLLEFFIHIKANHNTAHRKITNTYFTTFEYVISPGLLAKIRGRGYVSKLEDASINFYT
jgi:hypothetical protein